MSPKLRDPESHQPITSLDELDRAARRVAGIQEWDMDDPGRPFTPEYDDSMKEPEVSVTEPSASEVPAASVVDDEPEDATPSADNRDLYRMPTPERLKQTRKEYHLGQLAIARAQLQAASEKHKDVRI